jgi:putative transcriptional regulator
MPDHPELANRLKALRAAAGLTQAELADRVGVSRKTINTVENGVFVPSTILALKLSSVLDVPVEGVFELKPAKATNP